MSVNSKMTALADAIRAKTGGTDALTLDGMAEAVAGIEAGGGGGGFPNGTEWTLGNVMSGYANALFAYGGGTWVCSFGGLWYSTDGMTWTQSNITSDYDFVFAYGDGVWVTIDCNYGGPLYYSTDGMTWTRSNVTYEDIHWYSLVYGGGLFVCVSEGSPATAYYSTNGKQWSTGAITGGSCSYVTYCGGAYFASTNTGVHYSVDGKTWTLTNMTSDVACAGYITYAQGVWIALDQRNTGYGKNSGLWYSKDGMTWTQSNVTSGYVVNPTYGIERRTLVLYGNGVYVAGGLGLWYSTDGMTWTQSNVAASSVVDVHYHDGVFVAVGGGLWYSTDGMTWTQAASGNLRSVEQASGVWIACGEKTLYSNNGIEWSEDASTKGLTYTLEAKNNDGMWVLCARKRGMYYSPTWLPSD